MFAASFTMTFEPFGTDIRISADHNLLDHTMRTDEVRSFHILDAFKLRLQLFDDFSLSVLTPEPFHPPSDCLPWFSPPHV